jgi:hypothetical protein
MGETTDRGGLAAHSQTVQLSDRLTVYRPMSSARRLLGQARLAGAAVGAQVDPAAVR